MNTRAEAMSTRRELVFTTQIGDKFIPCLAVERDRNAAMAVPQSGAAAV